MENSNTDTDYEWEQIPTWTARYKCAKTGVLGYRGILLALHRKEIDPGEIYPYTCKTCKQPATHHRKNTFYCDNHGKPNR